MHPDPNLRIPRPQASPQLIFPSYIIIIICYCLQLSIIITLSARYWDTLDKMWMALVTNNTIPATYR